MLTFTYADRERQVATTDTTARERRIEEAAKGRLRRSSHLVLRDIGCTCREGVMMLRGYLPTYYLKQIAQHMVAEIDGVRGIINQLRFTGVIAGAVLRLVRNLVAWRRSLDIPGGFSMRSVECQTFERSNDWFPAFEETHGDRFG